MKNKAFQEIIENLQSAVNVWDWDEADSNVERNLASFIEKKPSSSQIAEYIKELSGLPIGHDHENFSYVCSKILDEDTSAETLTTIIKTLSNLEPNKEYYSDDISKVFIKIINEHPERINQIKTIAQKNGFDGVFAHRAFSEPNMLKMLETLNTAQKNNDKKALKKFQAKIAKASDKEIYQIDHAAMTWLISNFTQENFDKVNKLRAFWGLKAVVSEESLTEKNLRDVRRMEFAHSVSKTDASNPHYEHTYSEAYKNFVPDYNVSFKKAEYVDALANSPAAQILKEHGFSSFVAQLPDVFQNAHVPPSLVPKLYIKDLQHLLIEHHCDKIYNGNRISIFDFDKVGINHEAGEIRKIFWQEVAKDKDLVKFISNDLKKKGIDQTTIKKIWERAKEYGNPNERIRDFDGDDTVRSVYFNVHHRVALKDGGTNTPDNFVIVLNMPGVVNSHLPLHEYDSPLIHLYKHKNVAKNGVIISDKPTSKDDMEIRLNTVFVLDEENSRKNINKHVLYYGGPHTSIYVGKVHKSVRSALNGIDNIYKRINDKVKKQTRDKTPQPQNNAPSKLAELIATKGREM